MSKKVWWLKKILRSFLFEKKAALQRIWKQVMHNPMTKKDLLAWIIMKGFLKKMRGEDLSI